MTDLPIELARHYREEADRVRKLASDAQLPGVRDALLSVVRQYDDLAEGMAISAETRSAPGKTESALEPIRPDFVLVAALFQLSELGGGARYFGSVTVQERSCRRRRSSVSS
jgi:hypothetical protein